MQSEVTEKTVVFEISLPDDESCHECSYLELLQKHLESTNNKCVTDPLAVKDATEDKSLVDLAKALEKKYGTMVTMKNSGKNKRVRIDDYLDPGDGYDTQDSFIDDSEAVDVFLAPNVSTKFGGFFVHQGVIEGHEDQGVKIETPWNARLIKNNCGIPNVIRKKNKSRELLEKAVKRLSTPNPFKQKNYSPESRTQMKNLDSVFDEVLTKSNIHQQAETVINVDELEDQPDPNKTPYVTSDKSENPVNDTKEPENIPLNFPLDITLCLTTLIEINRQNGFQQRRAMGKPFDSELLKLDSKLREKSNHSIKSHVFGYLERNLQLKHKTILRRLKKLKEDCQEQRMNPLLDTLGDAISSLMPPLLESYARDKESHSERIKIWQVENQANESDLVDNQLTNVNSSTDINIPKRTSKPGPPKKLFRWNPDCKQLFEQIILCRLESYRMLNVKCTLEDYLKRLFPTLIQLWPEGWISNAALWRVALPIFQKFSEIHSTTNNNSTTLSNTKIMNPISTSSHCAKENNSFHSSTANISQAKSSHTVQSSMVTSSHSSTQGNSSFVVIPALSPSLVCKSSTPVRSSLNHESCTSPNGPSINISRSIASNSSGLSTTETNTNQSPPTFQVLINKSWSTSRIENIPNTPSPIINTHTPSPIINKASSISKSQVITTTVDSNYNCHLKTSGSLSASTYNLPNHNRTTNCMAVMNSVPKVTNRVISNTLPPGLVSSVPTTTAETGFSKIVPLVSNTKTTNNYKRIFETNVPNESNRTVSSTISSIQNIHITRAPLNTYSNPTSNSHQNNNKYGQLGLGQSATISSSNQHAGRFSLNSNSSATGLLFSPKQPLIPNQSNHVSTGHINTNYGVYSQLSSASQGNFNHNHSNNANRK